MKNLSTAKLETKFVKLSREVISTMDQAKQNTSAKMAIRAELIARKSWNPKRIDKLKI